MSKHHKLNAHRRRVLRAVLMWAQAATCPHCGRELDLDTHPLGPDYPTLDHLRLASRQGETTTRNILVKHRVCNEERGDKKPTQEDWRALSLVQDRLLARPASWQECEELARAMVRPEPKPEAPGECA